MNKNIMWVNDVNHIMVVNKNYDIMYNSRFDARMGNKSDVKVYKNLFEMYPSIGRENSTIVKAISTGESSFMGRQEFADKNGNIYVSQNLTMPIYKKGKIIGAVEITKVITTVGDTEKPKRVISGFLGDTKTSGQDIKDKEINFDDILTVDKRLIEEKERAKVFAKTPNPILLYGETGTGKELFAQAMINHTKVPKRRVIIQNCATIPENLMESILFGTTKGSYTGAENRKGLFEEADGGLLFLDELNSLPFAIQGKLLRVIQDGTFRPVGSNQEKKVNVKIVAAMNVDPMEAIENNILRKDLFYRLSGNMVYITPLRERRDDIDLLINHYIEKYNLQYGKNVEGVSEALLEFFHNYKWEGNVRELKHVIDTMVSMSGDDILDFNDLPIYLSNIKPNGMEDDSRVKNKDYQPAYEGEELNLRKAIEKTERDLITRALNATRGNKTKAGALLGIPRQTLKYKMGKLKIDDIEKE